AGTKVSGRLALPESVEDAGEIRPLDSPASIFDGKSHCTSCLFTGNNDSSAFGRELDCIVQQVGKNLKNPAAVHVNRKGRIRCLALQLNGLGACLKAECLADLIDDTGGIFRMDVERNLLSPAYPGDSYKVFDQAAHT